MPSAVLSHPKRIDLPLPRVQTGDIWQLGHHRLLCGDSRDAGQVERLFQNERPRLTVTSPPYNLGHSATLGGRDRYTGSRYLHEKDTRTSEAYLDLLTRVTQNCLVYSDMVILNLQQLAGNKIAFVEFLYRFRHHLADVAVWNKSSTTPAMAKNVLNAQFEWLLFLTAHKSRSTGRVTRSLFTADFRGTVSNVYHGPPQRHNCYFALHAATFPLHLPLWLMQTFDSQQGAVFDPFLGTGTTLLAAEQLGRRCFGMEIEPAYCDIVIQRWENATGQKARRLRSATE